MTTHRRCQGLGGSDASHLHEEVVEHRRDAVSELRQHEDRRHLQFRSRHGRAARGGSDLEGSEAPRSKEQRLALQTAELWLKQAAALPERTRLLKSRCRSGTGAICRDRTSLSDDRYFIMCSTSVVNCERPHASNERELLGPLERPFGIFGIL
eukprot:6201851-Pleurochrysis_carterae.AAC.2